MHKSALVVYRHLAEAAPYSLALEAAGVEPRLEEARAGLTLRDASGLLLTGGSDVNPALYGEAASPDTQEPDDDRDACERALVDEVLRRDLPLFAICRGMQLLNAHLGGTLIQHLDTSSRHVRRTDDRALPAHAVAIEPGTRLAAICGVSRLDVNSRHHQAVKTCGLDLRVCASDADDGTIEAIEIPAARYVLAVQWHPENQAPVDSQQRRLFESFADVL